MRALRIERKARKFHNGPPRVRCQPGDCGTHRTTRTRGRPPELPGDGWRRVRPLLTGICGSDLSTVEGHASTYFDDWISFPFVPGHEVVGLLDDGTRVVLEPVLGHEAHGFAPPFPAQRPATATTTPTSPRATSNQVSRSASAARPVAAGRRSSSPTTASCTPCLTR